MDLPATNEVVETIPVGQRPTACASAAAPCGSASPLDYAVVRLDPDSAAQDATPARQPADAAGLRRRRRVGEQPVVGQRDRDQREGGRGRAGRSRSAAAPPASPSARARVWVANTPDGTVSRIDPRRGVVTATIPVGAATGPPTSRSTRDGVWVSNEFGGTVARIDPRARTGSSRSCASATGRRGWRSSTARCGSASPTRAPATEAARCAWSPRSRCRWKDSTRQRATRRRPMSSWPHQRRAHRVPAPEAAAAPPRRRTSPWRCRRRPTAAAATRSGCGAASAYSTGSRCARATSASGSSARCATTRSRPALFGGIRGRARLHAEALRPVPRHRGRRRGRHGRVPADRAGPRLAVQARAAVREPSAAERGVAAPAKRALPATGPYVIAEFEPRPVRAPGTQPAVQVVVAGGAARRLPRCDHRALRRRRHGRRGRASWPDARIASSLDTPAGAAAQRCGAARRRSCAHRSSPATVYFVLNTRRAPFDRLDARRAVAFAFDRRAAVTAAGGHDVAQETCQILPPNFPGSRPYCPYTASGAARGPSRPRDGAPAGPAVGHERDARDRARAGVIPAGRCHRSR